MKDKINEIMILSIIENKCEHKNYTDKHIFCSLKSKHVKDGSNATLEYFCKPSMDCLQHNSNLERLFKIGKIKYESKRINQ